MFTWSTRPCPTSTKAEGSSYPCHLDLVGSGEPYAPRSSFVLWMVWFPITFDPNYKEVKFTVRGVGTACSYPAHSTTLEGERLLLTLSLCDAGSTPPRSKQLETRPTMGLAPRLKCAPPPSTFALGPDTFPFSHF